MAVFQQPQPEITTPGETKRIFISKVLEVIMCLIKHAAPFMDSGPKSSSGTEKRVSKRS
jgi:hypothetical protein